MIKEASVTSILLILLLSQTINLTKINQASATIPPWLLPNKSPIYIHTNGSITPQTRSMQKKETKF